MIYQDRLYGKTDIKEPVFIELIKSQTMQRLKGIDQAGYLTLTTPKKSYSRFEHSLGVFCLLRKYNSSLEEQVAGIIHDVSHSAFSHTIDYVLKQGSEKEHNHQDNIFHQFVNNSEIPGILGKHGIKIGYILDDTNFPLKERTLPDLCADRIDYTLRNILTYKDYIPSEENVGIEDILGNLIVIDNKWVFRNIKNAEIFASIFSWLNKNFYSSRPTVAMFKTTADYLRYSLESGYITEEDLYTTDDNVLQKINQHLGEDSHLKLLQQRIKNFNSHLGNKNDYDAVVFCKSRAVNPLCIHNGNIRRLSELYEDWARRLQDELKPKEYFIKFYD